MLARSFLAGCDWLLLTIGQASGDVIFDSGSGAFVNAQTSSSSAQVVANDFVLQTGANTVTDIHWTGGYVETSLAEDFTIQIYDDASAVPGNLIITYAVGNAFI